MKIWITLLLATASLNAAVEDKIALFSAKAIQAADKELAAIKAKTDKDIIIMALPDLAGKNITAFARDKAIEKKLNGAIIVISKSPRQLELIPGRKTALVLTMENRKKIIDMFSKGLKVAPDKTLAEATKYLSDLFLKADKTLIQADLHDQKPAPAPVEPQPLGWLKRMTIGISFLLAAGIAYFIYRRRTVSSP